MAPNKYTEQIADELSGYIRLDSDEAADSELPTLHLHAQACGFDSVRDLVERTVPTPDEPEIRALSHLLKWEPGGRESLGERGAAAADELEISYDGLRRRSGGSSRLDNILLRHAERIAALGAETMTSEIIAPQISEPSVGKAQMFLSYSRHDDNHEGQFISHLRSKLADEFRFQTGLELDVFQDKQISIGQNRRRLLEAEIDRTSLLLVILTPSYVESAPCREELERFLEREKQLLRDDLVLVVYYMQLRKSSFADPLVDELLSRQYTDWRDMRFAEFNSPEVRGRIADLAAGVIRAIERTSHEASHKQVSAESDEAGLLELLADLEFSLPQLARVVVKSLRSTPRFLSFSLNPRGV